MASISINHPPHKPNLPIRVNGKVIARADIAREAQNHPASSPMEAQKAAALALVVREALRQEADRLNVRPEPLSDGDGRRETDEESAMRILVEQATVVPEPIEEECRRYYERNRSRFRSPTIFEAAHILYAADRKNAEAYDAARRWARATITDLLAGRVGFADAAWGHSVCSSREVGGSLGQITSGQTTPEFEAALFAMDEGTITPEPVETRYGLHIIRLERRIDGRTLPFGLVQENIAGYLVEAARRRAQAQYIARLLGRSRVEGIELPSPGDLNVH